MFTNGRCIIIASAFALLAVGASACGQDDAPGVYLDLGVPPGWTDFSVTPRTDLWPTPVYPDLGVPVPPPPPAPPPPTPPPTPPPVPDVCEPGMPTLGQRWVRKGALGLNLRSEPTTQGGDKTVITVIPEGKDKPIAYHASINQAPGWACVTFEKHTGYVSATYLAKDPPPATAAATIGGGWCVDKANSGCGVYTIGSKPCAWRKTADACDDPYWLSFGNLQCCTWVFP